MTSVLRQFLVYGIGGAASRLAAIVLVPLYTRALSIDAYGRLELALAVHALVVIVAGMQVESAVARDFFEARRRHEQPVLAWTALALTVAGSLVTFALIALTAATGTVSAWLEPGLLMLLGMLTLPAQLMGVQLVMLRFDGRARFYAALSFADLVLCAVFSAWFIVALDAGVNGALAGILAAKLACVLIAWPATIGVGDRPFIPWRHVRTDWARRLLGYGVPSMPAVLVSWLQNTGNRVIIAATISLQDVAIAGVALKVAALFGFLVYSLRLAWEPHSIARVDTHADDPNYYRCALEWYVVLMFLALAFTVLLVPWAVRLLAPEAYAAAGAVAIFMVAAQYWVGVTNMTVIGIQASRQMSRLLPVYGWGAAANVLILLATARELGPLSAGCGLLAGTIVSALLSSSISNRVFGTRFPRRLMAVALFTTTLLALALWQLLRVVGNPASDAALPSDLALWFGAGSLAIVLLAATLTSLGLGLARCRAMYGQALDFLSRRAPAA